MPDEKTLRRWAKDIAATKSMTGKRVDSLRFHDVAGGKERVSLVLHDGTRLVIEGGGPLRVWTYCCGKPDPGPCKV